MSSASSSSSTSSASSSCSSVFSFNFVSSSSSSSSFSSHRPSFIPVISSANLPICLLLLLFSAQFISSSPIQQNSNSRETQQRPAAAMKMLPPKKLRNGERTLETEYFKPKEYTSRDFPRLIEGLGQQIRRDLDQAHSFMTAHAEQVSRLQERMDRLEREFHSSNRTAPQNEMTSAELDVQPLNKLLLALCLFLLLALALLLLTNLFLLKHFIGKKAEGTVKHVRLTSTCSDDQEQL